MVYEDDNVRVIACPVWHGSWTHAYGFRFETTDRIVVVSGDTAPCDSLFEHAKGCDVPVHKVYSHADFERRPPEWRRCHASSHTSTGELAEIASQVRPKLLILTHVLFWGSSPEELVEGIRRTYDGEVRCGRDLDVF